ncbi:hypothetical protein WK90_23080 [Burkholderia cepacia]|uniref:hypothetical protein n=1 Tax=Burkholderia cepacia TaxID=292 RepID=UPI00075E06E6|nr:hypothetical protein [Burkholderia cepacia]KVV54024.1 hypothetical protein WK83_26160 [Burkholderia cepacia]KVV62598.1 hypothetical protein WK85_05280 [Burkholderia cepacia]KVV68008.1 hypothetical protein WK84_20990 [Burkholderia cepacia]KVV75535.1 hypothetical protein WK86_29255 [Burkholderia cepacia]KVV79196.1 hypothetical protein WK87_29190 [Burkholderia cepacia]
MNKEQIFAALAPSVHVQPVKALGGKHLRFRELSGAERESFSRSMGEDYSQARFLALAVVATVVDEADTPIFTTDDIDAVKAISAPALEEIAAIALRVNKMGFEAEADAAKN